MIVLYYAKYSKKSSTLLKIIYRTFISKGDQNGWVFKMVARSAVNL